MFGFSLTKLLVLGLILAAVIIGFRVLGRMTNSGGENSPAAGKLEPRAFDTEYDAETDTYVVRGDKAERD